MLERETSHHGAQYLSLFETGWTVAQSPPSTAATSNRAKRLCSTFSVLNINLLKKKTRKRESFLSSVVICCFFIIRHESGTCCCLYITKVDKVLHTLPFYCKKTSKEVQRTDFGFSTTAFFKHYGILDVGYRQVGCVTQLKGF